MRTASTVLVCSAVAGPEEGGGAGMTLRTSAAIGVPGCTSASAPCRVSRWAPRGIRRVRARGALRCSADSTMVVKFSCVAKCPYGVGVVVTGSHDALGNWDPLEGLQLEVRSIWNWKSCLALVSREFSPSIVREWRLPSSPSIPRP